LIAPGSRVGDEDVCSNSATRGFTPALQLHPLEIIKYILRSVEDYEKSHGAMYCHRHEDTDSGIRNDKNNNNIDARFDSSWWPEVEMFCGRRSPLVQQRVSGIAMLLSYKACSLMNRCAYMGIEV
jgi:hypothetical protein